MRKFADQMTWAEDRGFAIDAAVDARMAFIRKTYLCLLAEILLTGVVATLVLKTPALLEGVAKPLAGSILIYILAFFGVSFVSRRLLAGSPSAALQLAGAGLWVLFLGILVAPFAWYVQQVTGSYAIVGQAFVMTSCVFAGLTAYVFFTRKDFSFMGGALSIVTMVVFGGSILYFVMGGGGGVGYSVLWVLLLGAWVLYDTSKLLHHRRVGQHVAASVDLLVDFIYLFLHILNILMRSRN